MAIETYVKKLGNVIGGRRIEIPPIQRDYDWYGSAMQLYEDLLQFHVSNLDSDYYLGSLIAWVDTRGSKSEESELMGDYIWQLLDGQQRLTSLTILLNEILIHLNEFGTQSAIETCNEIEKQFLFVSEELEDDEWLASLKPRRSESRDFLKWLVEKSQLDEAIKQEWAPKYSGKLPNIILVTIQYRKFITKYLKTNGPDGLIQFYNKLRDRVILGITLTDDLSMGFQMFQTANDRGTPLTSYDMFRAFSIKHATVKMGCTEKQIDGIIDRLNDVEETCNTSSDSEVKTIMTAWVTGRTGSHANKTRIIKDIELEVISVRNYTELKQMIEDLHDHAIAWGRYVGPSPFARSDKGTPVWIKIGRLELMVDAIHRPIVMELRNSYGEENNRLIDYVVSLIQWLYATDWIARALPTGGNTNHYQTKLPTLQNYIWNSGQKNGDKNKSLNLQLLNQEKNRLIDYIKTRNPEGFHFLDKALAFNQDDKREPHIRFLLHIVDTHMHKHHPGGNSGRMHVVKIIPSKKNSTIVGSVTQNISEEIGNYILIYGHNANGHSKSWIDDTLNETDNLKDRLKLIKNESSSSPVNNINADMNPAETRHFIRKRSQQIKQLLEEEYLKFINSTPPLA